MTGSLKDQGNELFKQGDYLKAAAVYTKAIKEAPSAVLYSNRSAALLKLNKVAKALADAEECVKLDPAFHKGYMRMALALESQQRLEEALDCYRKALQAADNNNSEYTARAKALSKAIGKKGQIAKAQSRRSPAEAAALAFAESKLAYAAELAKEHGSTFAPELFFLQGRSSSGGASSNNSSSSSSPDDNEEVAVRAEHAFAAPEVLAQFMQEMRGKAEELHASAVLLIAPKAAVQFPQTWRRAEWPFGQHDGVFVQLHASLKQATDSSSSNGADQQDAAAGRGSEGMLRKLWFIKFRENKPPVEPQEVSHEFEILPPLLR
ncbi:tetratricopeptide repeat protein, circadian expression [Scenedesmus sp. NREL 46B-D3]|nr:tetratricopeptide repeat protein, circadian expression [Scenedesmus sp. NREL 46B-D3]